jgi:hypothetical protein
MRSSNKLLAAATPLAPHLCLTTANGDRFIATWTSAQTKRAGMKPALQSKRLIEAVRRSQK